VLYFVKLNKVTRIRLQLFSKYRLCTVYITYGISFIIYQGKVATTDPSIKDQLRGPMDEADVVIDGNLITGKGLGTVMDLALAIVRKLFGPDRKKSLAEGLVYDYS
jgi:putative intracellular protease/amidase